MFADQSGFNEPGPLENRGWAFQERVLASRLLSFTRYEMTYECDSGCIFECGDVKSDGFDNPGCLMRRGGKQHSSFYAYDELEEDPEHPYVICSNLRKQAFATVLEASSRQDSEPESMNFWYQDVLPALSGIANRMNQKRFGDYCAGLWKNDLVYGLGWERASTGRLPSTYTAPSFSWASGIGSVKWADGKPPGQSS